MRIVLATENPHKIAEIRAILTPLIPTLELVSLMEIAPNASLPEETGETFAENAALKASYVAGLTGISSIGDDSGLCVDALDGAPGIWSRRWAGEDATDADRIAKLLAELAVRHALLPDQRGAAFISAAAFASPDGAIQTAVGECRGVILQTSRGMNGFGYDPLFYLPELGKTMAELSETDKNTISHRAHAMHSLALLLSKVT